MESDKEIGLLKSIFHIWSSEKTQATINHMIYHILTLQRQR